MNSEAIQEYLFSMQNPYLIKGNTVAEIMEMSLVNESTIEIIEKYDDFYTTSLLNIYEAIEVICEYEDIPPELLI